MAKAFVPDPLPPRPPVQVDGELGRLLDAASTSLGRLDGVAAFLPDPRLFLYTYIRKEAVLSSQIEGTQSSLTDLLQHELESTPAGLLEDVSEVSCSKSIAPATTNCSNPSVKRETGRNGLISSSPV